MSTAIAIITDGRKHCIERTIPSLLANWRGKPADEILIVDDSADPAYWSWLDIHFADFQRVHHVRRKGFGGAIRSAWGDLGDHDWIFHLEDDFIFNGIIEVEEMRAVLEARPDVLQMALKRQPWNPEEKAAGGFMEQHPDEYHDETTDGHDWCWQRRFFTTNPSLYRGSLTKRGWPDVEHSEGHFSLDIINSDPDAKFGFWGRSTDRPRVHHIGDERIGTGY